MAEPSIKPQTDEERRLRAAIWAVIDMFEGAVANQENRGRGGQHVPYHGDFATMSPSSVGQMRKWARDLREALKGKWPMLREEYLKTYGMEPSDSIDYMFREREP